MSIQVRYFAENHLIATSSAETMFDARHRLIDVCPAEADTPAIFALRSDGRELELEVFDL
jgi:hypothetical protein